MLSELESVVDILAGDDPEIPNLLTIEQLAHRWKCTPSFAVRRLKELGVRLCRIPTQVKVRVADVEEVERDLTTYLQPGGRRTLESTKETAKALP